MSVDGLRQIQHRVHAMNNPSVSGARRESADSDTEITLGVLDAVHANSSVTQRSVAQDVGIALGLANAYLKRCVRKGLIKVQQMPPNRYAYYLTPKGFSEKARLSAEYLSSSFTFFRRAREQCEEALDVARGRGWTQVGLLGKSELTEIATLCNTQGDLELVVLADDPQTDETFAGMPVINVAKATTLDGLILTELTDPQERFNTAVKTVGTAEKIIVPAMLRFITSQRTAD